MRYWDASALLAVVIDEPGTGLARGWLQEDGVFCTWVWSRVEIVSAIERRTREGLLGRSQRLAALSAAEALLSHGHEVSDVIAVRARATALLARHPLRAADAAQLAAALVVADADPAGVAFACLDRRLADAASREGLVVHGWPD